LKPETIYDLAIVGAGAAGLQLLYEYLQKAENIDKKILLVDSGDRSRKSWCFWSTPEQTPFPFLIEKSWSKITYRSTLGISKTEEIGAQQYNYISSEGFFNYFFENYIPDHTQITTVTGKVKDLNPGETHIQIELIDERLFFAKNIADSRIPPKTQTAKSAVYQHFWGKFVEFESDVLDSRAVTLMDFSQEQSNASFSVFHYILPFSARRALIETTVFSTEAYNEEEFEKLWNKYMYENFFGKAYKITGDERGTIPMVQLPIKRNNTGIFLIGTAAGQVKPSTGYAFTRMHRDAQSKVNQEISISKARYSFYDSILLHMILKENKVIPKVMDRLFSKMKFANILRFLDERTNIWEELILFSQMQIPLFIKHLINKNR
jgi:lycopene beta-cyclase